MLGILLTRQPSTLELVNDLDGNIFAWWTAVREHTGELARRLELSPVLSRQLYRESYQVLVDRAWEDLVDRAYRMAVVLCQGLNSKLGSAGAAAPGYRVVYSKGRRSLAPEYPSPERLYALARRLRRVQVERRDAVELLDRLAAEANSVVYVDPPYCGNRASETKEASPGTPTGEQEEPTAWRCSPSTSPPGGSPEA